VGVLPVLRHVLDDFLVVHAHALAAAVDAPVPSREDLKDITTEVLKYLSEGLVGFDFRKRRKRLNRRRVAAVPLKASLFI